MILASLAAATLGLATPLDGPSLDPVRDARTALVVRVEETRVELENEGLEPLLLLLGYEEGEPRLALCLAPGERASSSFPRGASDDVRIEVLQRDGSRLRATGALSLAAPKDGAARELWVQESGVVLGALAGEPIAPALPEGSLVPVHARGAIQGPSTELPASAPLHVPVPQPTGGSSGDKPPKLEEKPLPPV